MKYVAVDYVGHASLFVSQVDPTGMIAISRVYCIRRCVRIE